MDHGSQPQPSAKPAPIGTSIQAGADVIMALIEAERVNAAALAKDQFLKLERMFNAFRQQSMTIHTTNQARLAEAHQNIQNLQYRLAQAQPNPPMLTDDASQLPVIQGQPQYETEALRAEVDRATAEAVDARREEALAKKQFDDLQTAMQRVGIGFSREENSFRFEAGWAVVLAEVESTDRGPMNPDELHQILGILTRRLQGDREKINQLEQRLLSSDQEREKTANTHEAALASLRHEISTLRDHASRSSEQQIDSLQTTNLFSPSPVAHVNPSTFTSPQVSPPLPSYQPQWVCSVDAKSDLPDPNDTSQDMPTTAPHHDQIDIATDELPTALAYDDEVPPAPRIDLRSMQPERRKSHKLVPNTGT